MKPYGSKRNSYDFIWTGKSEIVVWNNDIDPKRARRINKNIINEYLLEREETEN